MRKIFVDLFDNYEEIKNKSFSLSENNIVREFLNTSLDFNKVSSEQLKVKASVGKGKWTETPWLGIFDESIKAEPTKGFYIVYLFKKDMSGVYLSLNQGTTYIQKKFNKRKPREKMSEVSTKLREMLNYDVNSFTATKIDLGSDTDNAKNYVSSHICGKFYSAEELPSQEILINDLYEMIMVYKQLRVLMGKRDTDEMIDYLLTIGEIEDIQFQSEVLISTPSKTTAPLPVPPRQLINERYQWKRDPKIAKESLINSNYQCEFNKEHITFISEVSGEMFMEAHHLIPMNLQNKFEYSLDVPGNIVSLCPNCHRMIHHAGKVQKNKLIEKLFHSRSNEMEFFKIVTSIEVILKAYNKS